MNVFLFGKASSNARRYQVARQRTAAQEARQNQVLFDADAPDSERQEPLATVHERSAEAMEMVELQTNPGTEPFVKQEKSVDSHEINGREEQREPDDHKTRALEGRDHNPEGDEHEHLLSQNQPRVD